MDHLCYLCLVFVMLLHLFIAALWSHGGKRLTSWLSFVMFNCVFVTFPRGILVQVWCLIVAIPYLCHLSYFYKSIVHVNKAVLHSSGKCMRQMRRLVCAFVVRKLPKKDFLALRPRSTCTSAQSDQSIL